MKMKKIFRKIICLMGIHEWQYCYAPIAIAGKTGRVEGKVCKTCPYKSSSGNFIVDQK